MRILHAQHAGEAQRFACASTAHAALELRERMMKLLAGEDPDPQDVLLAGYQCAELYQMVTAAGFEVISWGDHQAKLNGVHYVSVIRDIVFARGRLAGLVEPRLAPVTIRASGRKRSAPASYELRDENDELMEDASRTGPIIEWSWLQLPASPHASAQEWISFTMPAREQLLPSTLPAIAIFRLCTGPSGEGRTYQPWLLASESAGLPGQYAIYCLKHDTFAPPSGGAKGLQHTDIGPLHGELLGEFSSANLMRDAGDRVRRETGNHYLFSTRAGKQWRLLNGDVGELPLLKYANDVHGSGDVANAALIDGRLVALVRIRALEEVRWAYGWSQDMWREILAGDGPAHTRRDTQPRQMSLDGWLLSGAVDRVPKCPSLTNTLRITPPEKLITTGRGGGKLRVGKPEDVLITRPHAAANPFTRRIACANPSCLAGTCYECREATCDGYAQLISDAADVLGIETSISAIGEARELVVHAEYVGRDALAHQQALVECAEAVSAGRPVRLMCSCPLHWRCHRDIARTRILQLVHASPLAQPPPTGDGWHCRCRPQRWDDRRRCEECGLLWCVACYASHCRCEPELLHQAKARRVNIEGVTADVAPRSKLELLERQYAALGIRAQRQQVLDDDGRVGEESSSSGAWQHASSRDARVTRQRQADGLFASEEGRRRARISRVSCSPSPQENRQQAQQAEREGGAQPLSTCCIARPKQVDMLGKHAGVGLGTGDG